MNGRVQTRVSYPLVEGDLVDIELVEEEPPSSLTPEKIPLDKVYEDDTILVINKPRDMVVHPAPGHVHGTVVHALLHEMGERLKQEFPEEPWRPGIVHRLDKDTSGLLITVKTRRAKALSRCLYTFSFPGVYSYTDHSSSRKTQRDDRASKRCRRREGSDHTLSCSRFQWTIKCSCFIP